MTANGGGHAPRPLVVTLADECAIDPAVTGAKAANLAVALQHELATLPGLVVTTAAHQALIVSVSGDDELPKEVAAALRAPWSDLSAEGTRPLVVRSSSTIEDVGESSMAGQFRSILDVVGWDPFVRAVLDVFASARSAPGAQTGTGAPMPMAVLVQPMLDAVVGGVMFGVDPVTGDRGSTVVEAVAGGPDVLVSGRSTAQRYVLDGRGRVRTVDAVPWPHWPRHAPRMLLERRRLSMLHHLAEEAERTYGRPQDVEWAFDPDGRLWLLQSRPVTAVAAQADGPVLGGGPVAETFPDPLRPLEQELWVDPLRAGVTAALRTSGAVRAGTLGVDLVRVVQGRVVVDLEAFGYVRRRGPLRLLDPRPSLHRLALAWRVGRLRADLADRATDRMQETDTWLAQVPRLTTLPDDGLMDLMEQARDRLVAVHRDEVLVGTLSVSTSRTAASVALTRLATGHAKGLTDEQVVAAEPITLALVPPVIAPTIRLPASSGLADAPVDGSGAPISPREGLRLRARWLQELQARAAAELGRRLVSAGTLAALDDIALLTLDDVRAACTDGTTPADLADRRSTAEREAAAAPLPSTFRLAGDGTAVPAERRGARRAGGVGAGGGRGSGPVAHAHAHRPPEPGEVLVVRDLSPALAPYLPTLAGVVSESGSTLSHLAILAREYGIPTVVAAQDALSRYPEGSRLLVDGRTGELTPLEENA